MSHAVRTGGDRADDHWASSGGTANTGNGAIGCNVDHKLEPNRKIDCIRELCRLFAELQMRQRPPLIEADNGLQVANRRLDDDSRARCPGPIECWRMQRKDRWVADDCWF